MFVRFIRQPQSGLPDFMKGVKDKFDEFGDAALKTPLSKYLEG
jgi:hypothetical protein